LNRAIVFLIAGWSGFYVMSIELLSGRIIAPNFGSSIYVWGGIIAVFMLALSLGYLAGGRLSVERPTVRKLAIILLVAALTTVPVVLVGDRALDWIFDMVHDPRYGSLLSSTVLFFIPTVISGMVSPYAVRLLVHEQKLSGHRSGQLYFVSTLGSTVGTIATAFYLVLYLDINDIIWILVGVSVALAFAAMLWSEQRAN
jgi:hypothetical protein